MSVILLNSYHLTNRNCVGAPPINRAYFMMMPLTDCPLLVGHLLQFLRGGRSGLPPSSPPDEAHYAKPSAEQGKCSGQGHCGDNLTCPRAGVETIRTDF